MSSVAATDRELEKRLRETQLISDEQLQVVRQLRDETSVSLAQAIAELDILSASEVDSILASLSQIRGINIEEVDIDREAVRQVPAAVALRYGLLPLRRSGNSLVIAMTDPNDQQAMQALRGVTDYEIVPFLADPEAMEHALHLYYEGHSADAAARSKDSVGTIRSAEESWRCDTPRPVTLDTLIECDSNRQARNLGFQVAADNKEMYSCPVLLVGPPSSGKTHLLRAISAYVAAKHPMMRGLLISGQELKSRFADYALAGQGRLLRYELRDRQFTFIDHVGCLAGIRPVEHELCGVISSSRKRNAWVVCTLTADELINPAWLPELRTELENGLVVHMDTPDERTRADILTAHCDTEVVPRDKIAEFAKAADVRTALENLRGLILNASIVHEQTK